MSIMVTSTLLAIYYCLNHGFATVTNRQFCFISNTDNLGATVDLGILDLCLSGDQEFIMEVFSKSRPS